MPLKPMTHCSPPKQNYLTLSASGPPGHWAAAAAVFPRPVKLGILMAHVVVILTDIIKIVKQIS